MNQTVNDVRPYSAGLVLIVVMIFFTSFFASSIDNYENSEIEFVDSPSFSSAKAAGDWAKIGGTDSSATNGGSATTSTSHTDSSGNTFLTGFLIGDVKFGSLTKSSSQDAFIAKIDTNGNWQILESADQYAGGGYSWGNDITTDSSGNIFITGHFAGNISFGNNQLRSQADINGDDSTDIFVAKMSSSGNWLWAKSAGGSYDRDAGEGIVSDGNGGAYVVGSFNISGSWGVNSYGTNGYDDAFISHISSSGSWDWVLTGGGPGYDSADGVSVDNAGDLRVVGTFEGGSTQGAQFGSSSFQATGSPDIYVSKISSTGSWVWTKTAGAPSGMILPWGGIDTEGTDSYVGGLFSGTANFASQSITSAAQSNNLFIAKIDGSGAWQWAKASNSTGLNYIGSIDASSSGIAFAGGYTSATQSSSTSTITIGSDTLTGDYSEIFAGVIDSSGSWLWAKGGGSAGDDGYYNYGQPGVGWSPAGDVIASGHICQGMGSACTATFGSNQVTVTPGAWSTQVGLPPSVVVWKQASDADGDGIGDSSDNCPLVSNVNQDDIDSDSIGDACDPDIDEDGILNDDDGCDGPAVNWDSSVWANDIDMDGCRDIDEDDDDDADGILDVNDPCTGTAFKLNWTSSVVNDIDMDGCHDNEEDSDDDNDGIDDTAGDDCPRGLTNWGLPDGNGGHTQNASADYDSDGCEDESEDADDDNDEVNDLDNQGAILDRCSKGMMNWISELSLDYDLDGCRDSDEDWDDDNDGVNDLDTSNSVLDKCPKGAKGWLSSESTDRDGDGCRDIDEDDDTDGDGIIDTSDNCFVQVGWTSSPLTDYDGDGCRDMDEDDNDDNDPVYDANDDCEKGEIGWTETDFDGDGCRDESEDNDDDNDGICDGATSTNNVCSAGPDVCPETPLGEQINGDGCGLSTQVDSDGDGYYDAADDCVDEDSTGYDADGDGCIDDTDGDGTFDDVDAFPNDATQQLDADGDGWGDNLGQLNSDYCPATPSEWIWNVSNGTLGCAWEENDDDNDNVLNGIDKCPGSKVNLGRSVDSDGCTDWQKDADGDGVVDGEDTCANTGSDDTTIEVTGCSHEQRLAAGDLGAMTKEYGLIVGGIGGFLLLLIVGMLIMLGRRKGGRSMDAWDAHSSQLASGGYVAGQPVAPAPPMPVVQAVPQSVSSYAELPPGGNYVTDAAGGTWYNAPDGGQWAMQGDGSFIKN